MLMDWKWNRRHNLITSVKDGFCFWLMVNNGGSSMVWLPPIFENVFMTEKLLLTKLYYDEETKLYYVKMGKCLFIAKQTILLSLVEKEELEVVYVNSLNDVR